MSVQEDQLYNWINPIYLEPGVQGEIQEKFEADSEIELQGFFKVIINKKSHLVIKMVAYIYYYLMFPGRKV